jgi:hypothetical protein
MGSLLSNHGLHRSLSYRTPHEYFPLVMADSPESGAATLLQGQLVGELGLTCGAVCSVLDTSACFNLGLDFYTCECVKNSL